MSDPLPLPPSQAIEDEDDEAQEALLFARCSAASAEGAKSPSTSGAGKDEKAQHREGGVSLTNLRRSHLTYRHLVISLGTSLVISLALFFIGLWFYLQKIKPRLSAAVHAAPVTSAASSEQALSDALAKSAEQISALQKQVDVMRREQLLTQQNTRQSLENISATLKNPQLIPPAPATSAGEPGAPRMADVKLDVTPTQQEFIQLKERNRLTQYADEAIATGERRPLELLVDYMRDPQVPHLHDAAQAEFMRAVRAIQILQREAPGYRLPVAEIFKGDSNIRSEADVKPDDLLKLLADYKQSWEVRVRVCFLLLSSTLPETNAALVKAIKEDPSMDVAKHAQLSLEQRIKKRFRFLDIPSIEEWFKSQDK